MIDFHCDNCEFLQDKSNDNIIDGYCKKYNQSLTFYDWFEKCDKCLIETLQSENAALRERLEKAVELPVKVGDIVYCVDDEDGDYIVKPTVVTKKNIYLLCSRIKGNPSNAFLLQKAAEEWCKELKGEKE